MRALPLSVTIAIVTVALPVGSHRFVQQYAMDYRSNVFNNQSDINRSIADMVAEDPAKMFDLWETKPGSGKASLRWGRYQKRKRNHAGESISEWDGCYENYEKIKDATSCKEVAKKNARNFKLTMSAENWETGFIAGRGLNFWPQGCVVNKATRRVHFNNQPRPKGETLKFKFARKFEVICNAKIYAPHEDIRSKKFRSVNHNRKRNKRKRKRQKRVGEKQEALNHENSLSDAKIFDLWETTPGSGNPSLRWRQYQNRDWYGCKEKYEMIQDATSCKEVAKKNARNFKLSMLAANWETGFIAGRGLNFWPQGCVVNKATRRVHFNNQPRPKGQTLKFKFARKFEVICIAKSNGLPKAHHEDIHSNALQSVKKVVEDNRKRMKQVAGLTTHNILPPSVKKKPLSGLTLESGLTTHNILPESIKTDVSVAKPVKNIHKIIEPVAVGHLLPFAPIRRPSYSYDPYPESAVTKAPLKISVKNVPNDVRDHEAINGIYRLIYVRSMASVGSYGSYFTPPVYKREGYDKFLYYKKKSGDWRIGDWASGELQDQETCDVHSALGDRETSPTKPRHWFMVKGSTSLPIWVKVNVVDNE